MSPVVNPTALLSACTACLLALVTLLTSSLALSNTAGVFPPDVQEGHRSFQYRVGLDPDNGTWGSRLHYQQSLNDNFMARGIIQGSESSAGNTKVDFAQAELFWALSKSHDRLRHGLRFDARVRGRSMPSSFSANYSLLYDFSDTWQGRLAFLNTRSFGDEASNDVKLQVRSQLSYRASPRLNFNIEYYSQLGSVDNVSPWNSQQHQIGPSISWRTNTDWVVYGGILTTLNNRSPDSTLRFWLTKHL